MLLLEYSPVLTIPRGLHERSPFETAGYYYEPEPTRRIPWDTLVWSGMTFGFEVLKDAENNAAIGCMEAIYAMAAYRNELTVQRLIGAL